MVSGRQQPRAVNVLADFILRRPRSIIISLVLVTLVLGFFAARVQIDDSVETMLLYEDPERVYYRHFLERFGSDELVVIALKGPRVFDAPSLERIKRISNALARLSLDDGDA